MSGPQEEDKKPGDQSAAQINLKVKGQETPFFSLTLLAFEASKLPMSWKWRMVMRLMLCCTKPVELMLSRCCHLCEGKF
ncbi:hypothetical protein V6N13_045020 [Hibiscus sabdariffa]|uniref:Uncharacterized protein n=1 Tax=Hibiscus sabdariffa TaxID=183260 RepID=A0ABR2RK94_9ROSI